MRSFVVADEANYCRGSCYCPRARIAGGRCLRARVGVGWRRGLVLVTFEVGMSVAEWKRCGHYV